MSEEEFGSIGEFFSAVYLASTTGNVDPRLKLCDPGPPLTEEEIVAIEEWADTLLEETV